MTDNVRYLPSADPLPERIRAALNRTKKADQEWIEATLELASLLSEARKRFNADRDFSYWIVDTQLEDINHQDRAALIAMAADIDLARIVLQETTRNSWQLIWHEEMKARFTSASKPSPTSSYAQNTPEIPANPPENDDPASTENAIPDLEKPASAEPVPFAQQPVSLKMMQLSPLGKLPQAETVLGFVLRTETRSQIAELVNGRKNHPLWLLICEAIDTGAFGEPSNAHVTKKPNLRLVLPWVGHAFAQRFDLSKKRDIERVRTEVLPIVLEHRAALLANPDLLPKLIQDADAARAHAKRREIEQVIVDTAVQKMPTSEQEVIAFGTRIWPQIADGGFTYDELCYAVWFFQWMVDQLRADWSAASKAIQLRHTVKHLRPMLKGNCASAILEICTAYGSNPGGECSWPPRPINYGIS